MQIGSGGRTTHTERGNPHQLEARHYCSSERAAQLLVIREGKLRIFFVFFGGGAEIEQTRGKYNFARGEEEVKRTNQVPQTGEKSMEYFMVPGQKVSLQHFRKTEKEVIGGLCRCVRCSVHFLRLMGHFCKVDAHFMLLMGEGTCKAACLFRFVLMYFTVDTQGSGTCSVPIA